MAKLSPNRKGVERVDAYTGQRFIEDLDIAVNRTTKLVDKSYEIYLPRGGRPDRCLLRVLVK